MAKIFINKENKNDNTNHKAIYQSTVQAASRQLTHVQLSPVQVSSLTWFQALTSHLQELVLEGIQPFINEIEEIRLRIKRPIVFRTGSQEMTVTSHGKLTSQIREGYSITREDIDRSIQLLSQSSLYAWEDEFKNGYITIPGGHRIGFVGRVVLDKGCIKTLKDISGINYRIGRQILGCADDIMSYLIHKDHVHHTLIISPPQCGKTTLIRDIVKQLSDGIPDLGFTGVNVGLVDERSEIAGVYQGEPQFQIGLRTDILDACPKAQGMMILIRSMSPRVIATDEIGKNEDIEALYHALQAGVTVVTTVHGNSVEEIRERPSLKELVNWRFFERIIILSRRKGVGTVEAILNGKTQERMKYND